MLISSDYNKLAWSIYKKYKISQKWAFKIAYAFSHLDNTTHPIYLLDKPGAPLEPIWYPSNVMKMVVLIRNQATKCGDPEGSEDLLLIAKKIYNKYRLLDGIGAEFISQFNEGEVLYWAVELYTQTMASKKRSDRDLPYLTVTLKWGESPSDPWF